MYIQYTWSTLHACGFRRHSTESPRSCRQPSLNRLDDTIFDATYAGCGRNSYHPEGGQYEFILVDEELEGDTNEDHTLVIRYVEDGNDLIDKGNAIELARFLNADDIEIPY